VPEEPEQGSKLHYEWTFALPWFRHGHSFAVACAAVTGALWVRGEIESPVGFR
jgi:hypothetical protein